MGIINENFMLHSQTARELYKTAADRPIIDYHCHLSPRMIAEDSRFNGICDLLLGEDHYKWRLMRQGGVDESLITGNASDAKKFAAFAQVLSRAIGNPIYHWTHLELVRYFDIDTPLCVDTAEKIRQSCDEMLSSGDFTARSLIRRSKVRVLCTTDDPLDSLEWHDKTAADGFEVKVLPTFRPDRALQIEKDSFLPYLERMGAGSYNEFCDILVGRMDYFAARGCRISDCSLERVPFAVGDPAAVFDKRLSGKEIGAQEADIFKTAVLRLLGGEYSARGWSMQLHIGALRNNNSAMLAKLGADSGFDSINDLCLAEPLSRLLDSLALSGSLPQTILYPLNPKDNIVLAAMAGNFCHGPTAGKLQLGPAWWFCDSRDGMTEQLRTFANLGVLGSFVGMLTDSRSFVSYTRHEYFRRILCDLIGSWVERGEYPKDFAALTTLIEDICFKNAERYFGF